MALLGPSGSGKSTLLAALRRQRETLCAWCPQEQALVPMLSVFHNIYMGGLHRHGTWHNLRTLLRPAAADHRPTGLTNRPPPSWSVKLSSNNN